MGTGMKRMGPTWGRDNPNTLKEVPEPAAPRQLMATGWYHKTTKTLFEESNWQEPTRPHRYGGIGSCPALPSQHFSLPCEELDFCCYIPQGHLEDVKHCFSFKEKYFPALKEWEKKYRKAQKHDYRAFLHLKPPKTKPTSLYLLLSAFKSQYLKPSLQVLLGGREQNNELIILPHCKQSAARTCLSSVVMEGDEQQYFTLPNPWSTSIISSPVPPHASGEDPRRFMGGWFWITSPQGNFPPNTHKPEVDLYPTYNRLYSLETTPCLQPRCHCWNWRFGLV